MNWTRQHGYDGSGAFVEWYTDDDGGSGLGGNPKVQRWYGPNAPQEPDPTQWTSLKTEDGPDRTDPGYWMDNR